MQQNLSSNEMYGIAKRINNELEEFPMHTHSAIVEMVRVGMQHRNLTMQADQNAKTAGLQERALKVQEQQTQLARMAQERESASRIQLVNAGASQNESRSAAPESEQVALTAV
jgi:hypothetical protein